MDDRPFPNHITMLSAQDVVLRKYDVLGLHPRQVSVIKRWLARKFWSWLDRNGLLERESVTVTSTRYGPLQSRELHEMILGAFRSVMTIDPIAESNKYGVVIGQELYRQLRMETYPSAWDFEAGPFYFRRPPNPEAASRYAPSDYGETPTIFGIAVLVAPWIEGWAVIPRRAW